MQVDTLPSAAELSRPAEAAGSSLSWQPSAPTPTSIQGVRGSRTVQRQPEERRTLPARTAMAVVDHMCLEPLTDAGTEYVHASMGVLTFTVLLRDARMVCCEELDMFSGELVRETAADEELADTMAPCMKLEMLGILGRRTFKLAELFPRLDMDYELAEKVFLVPPGRLSAGTGQRDAQVLSKAQVCEFMERIRLATVAAVDRLTSNPDDSVAAQALEIGFSGVGHKGMGSMVVLVEAEDNSRAWGLVMQSAHSSAAQEEYDTVRGILKAMQSDLKETHRLPPLHEEWVAWADKESADSMHVLPKFGFPDAAWDASAWDERVVYCYVSDRIFSRQQVEIRDKLMERRHPWMRRTLIISRSEQAAWYARTGALLRYIRAVARKFKTVRDTLRGGAAVAGN
ncbi:g9385 [Coccomyxa elongata]